eukprot:1158165-Pelagomonas_calceolata.AAC.12
MPAVCKSCTGGCTHHPTRSPPNHPHLRPPPTPADNEPLSCTPNTQKLHQVPSFIVGLSATFNSALCNAADRAHIAAPTLHTHSHSCLRTHSLIHLSFIAVAAAAAAAAAANA